MIEETYELMFETESELSTYCPIERCIVIESHFKRRREMIKKLRGTGIFSHISEPQSFTSAIESIRSNTVDVCIIGPSLSLESIRTLIDQTRTAAINSNLVYISFGRYNQKELEDLRSIGVTNTLTQQMSPRLFYKNIANAVLPAEPDQTTKQDNSNNHAIPIPSSSSHTETQQKQSSELCQVLELLNSSKIRIDEIRRLVQQIAKDNKGSRNFEDFFRYFNRAYGDWYTDAYILNQSEADQLFRTRLLAYDKELLASSH